MSKYLTVKDVADMLQITEKKSKALFKVEGFPCVRIGVKLLVREEKLNEWLDSHVGESIKLDYTSV